MSRRRALLAALAGLAASGCSDATDAGDGIVALEVLVPSATTFEVSDSLRLTARALGADGQEVAAAIQWVTPDTNIAVNPSTGWIVGRSPTVPAAPSRVQARLGALASNLISLTVVARPDTLALVEPAAVEVAVDAPASAPLAARVEAFATGPIGGDTVYFQIVEPVFAAGEAPTVVLGSGGVADSVATVTTGIASTTVARVPGVTPPDRAVVAISVRRLDGVLVAGSGQQFVVTFLK